MSLRLPAGLCFAALLALAPGLRAQKASVPTLDEILGRLQENLNHYDKDLPSLFCDEHVVSQILPSESDRDTVTDSVLRLRRIVGAGYTTRLEESREVKSVNGKPAKSQDVEGPSVLSGVFEGALAVVSEDQKACMKYTLQRAKGKKAAEGYIVRFATALTPENSAGCLLQEKSEGRAFIDAASIQITHLELTSLRHVIVHGNGWDAPIIGRRTLTVDYAPVVLGEKTFWLPSVISQQSVSGENSFHRTEWSYRATYRSCHRTEVTSRILPGVPTQ